jgi:hypothetical protein
MKKLVVALVIVVMVGVGAMVLVKQQTPPENTNATVLNIRSGVMQVACEDASWLYGTMKNLVAEKLALLEPYEDGGENTEEQREVMLNTETPAQKEFNVWHDQVIVALNDYYGGDTAGFDNASYALGKTQLELYQAAVSVDLELMNEEEFLALLQEQFCGAAQ